jgi:hypothetical protein
VSSLAEFAHREFVRRGFVRVDTEPHHSVERRKWPIVRADHMPVLNGIKMDVPHMTREIVVGTNAVLPIAPLPNSAFAMARATGGNRFRTALAAK